jgi:hypothetical protein
VQKEEVHGEGVSQGYDKEGKKEGWLVGQLKGWFFGLFSLQISSSLIPEIQPFL